MDKLPTAQEGGRPGPVWDGPTRWFHWSNGALVLLLAGSGLVFQYRTALSIDGLEAKMALKAAHSIVGYAFLLNLGFRVVWAFVGNRLARWRSILPERTSFGLIGEELRDLRARRPVRLQVRSPVSRVSATAMFLLLLLLAGTGLVRAGTDLYYFPLGPVVAKLVAKPGVAASDVTWRNEPELGDRDRIRKIAKVKTATGLPHEYGSWVLLGLVALHIAGVTLTEIRQRSGLVSAMVSGHFPPGPAPRPPESPPAA